MIKNYPLKSMKASLIICLLALFVHAQSPDSQTSSRQPSGQLTSSIFARGGSPGDLDPTFSGDGKLTDGVLSDGNELATAIALQADGKIVVAGYSGVARYNPDGSIDSTFGANGQVTGFAATAVAIQSDGKIVIGCTFNIGSNTDFGLIRYTSDGSLDTSFGTDGEVSASITPGYDIVTSIAIQLDGKIVVAGYVIDPVYSFAVARFNSDGSLDTSFDGDGKLTTLVGLDRGFASSVTLQMDGKIVLGGAANMGSGIESAFVIIRYNVNGSLDTSFDLDGIVTTSFRTRDFAYSVAVQSDGKIVAGGGASETDVGDEFALARYNSDGSLDTTFDLDGKLTTSLGVNQVGSASSIAIQSNGAVVAVGTRTNVLGNDLVVVRYNSNGSLDTTFDLDGIVTTDGGGDELFTAVTIQPDGRIVGAGFGANGTYLGVDFIVARYSDDGSLDTAFDADGLVVTNLRVYHGNVLSDVAVQADGKIVVVGTSLARYNSDGTRDATFGGGTGLVNLAFLGKAIAVQSNGKILIAGYTGTPGGPSIAKLARFDQDGSLDSSFGDNGIVSIGLGGEEDYDTFLSLAVQRDGKIIAGGSNTYRFNTTGSPDTTFGGGTGFVAFYSRGVTIQPDDKIVVARPFYDNGTTRFSVARLNPNGSLDNSFDGDGTVITPIGTYDDANSVAIQADGKIVAAGYSYNVNALDTHLALVRYNTDGSLDTTFDSDGIITTHTFVAVSDPVASVAIERDGKLVVASSSNRDFEMRRYLSNGSLDTTFGGDGISTADFNLFSDDRANGMAIDSNGRAVVVGSSDGAFGLARIILGPGAVAADHTPFDFDGDGRSDISVFRPSDRVWYLDRSTEGFTAVQFGISTDRIVPTDYDGDGKTDIAVYRPASGVWYVLSSVYSTVANFQFGVAEDLPAPADLDGDGRCDLTVFRPSTGIWYSRHSSDNSFNSIQFGTIGDIPTVGDFDGDGNADIGVYRASDGTWYRTNSSNDSFYAEQFGNSTDLIVPADYDGDGTTDLAVYRPSDGYWYIKNSGSGTYSAFPFGLATDIPAPGDFDGDGKADLSVFRPSDGTWYRMNSVNGSFVASQFGINGDKPTMSAFRY